MTTLQYRILFFGLIPIAIAILIYGIKLLRRSFNGSVIFELQYNNGQGKFSIDKSGIHSIWQDAPLFKKTPLANFRPKISNIETGEVINLNKSVLSPRTTGFSRGRMELFTFYAHAGKYQLLLGDGSSVSAFEKNLGRAIPMKDVEPSKYIIQVRKSQSQIYSLFGIVLTVIGGGGIIMCFVHGLLADQLFN